MSEGHRPMTLRVLALVSRVAHRVTGGRVGAAEPGKHAPRGRALAIITRVHRSLYSWTGGIVGGNAGGLATLLLTTTGRRTGKARTVPLPYFRDSERYVVIASNAGQERNPAWLENLLATPEVRLQIGFEKRSAQATVATGSERERIWRDVVASAPMYADYQRVTAREIAVVVLLLGLLVGALGCGARTDPGDLTSPALDSGGSRDRTVTDAPADQLAPCAAGGPPPTVYALDDNGVLYLYDPTTGRSTALGTPDCGNSSIAWTVSASVDHAFIVYTDWSLDVVSLPTLACSATPFVPGQLGLDDEFGVAAVGSGATERLYFYGVPTGGTVPILAVTDTQSYVLQRVGDVLPVPANGGDVVNLTAGSDGMLYAFSPLGLVQQIDPATAAVVRAVDTGVTSDGTWATIAYGSKLLLWVDQEVVGYDLASGTRTSDYDSGVSAIGASAVGGCAGP